jgi:glucose/arabinose dehydrogenase
MRPFGLVAFGLVLLCAAHLVRATCQVTSGKEPSLPPPSATPSAQNPPRIVTPPAGFLPRVPEGFGVNVFARQFQEPRWLEVAPNGDAFVADSAAGQVIILRDPHRRGVAESQEVFGSGLELPFGIAFHDACTIIARSSGLRIGWSTPPPILSPTKPATIGTSPTRIATRIKAFRISF